ncbi:glucosylceramidase [Rhizosphaericola mali]|uniref:Glucosylceramidase n=2 Tax=Rhizosphaericola mali TaxID=2545455 RepID=A0A5P2G6E4_9BACT|nr:glucosylceramidase [Rhizosphaericola mali]
MYLTDPDYNVLFAKKKIQWKVADNTLETIKIDASASYQAMDGFGFTLTGGSAQLLMKMDATTRQNVLQLLFATTGNNIGISYLRVSIGASDLNDHAFTYDDLSTGAIDASLSKFNLGPDSSTIVPLLKEILAINPNIPILGSPWSAPAWMKDNNSLKAGSLKNDYMDTYANYFVKYIQTMKNLGINIAAITPQNEPMNGNNNPSMVMTSDQQASFVKVLGAKFKANSITSKIIVWDHNADDAAYPIAILNDANAAQFVDGSAFHLYAGNISALSDVHNQFPNKNLYFTEQWVGAPSNLKGDLGWHVENLIIGAPRNWSKNVLEWNLASDPNLMPHTDGGCSNCLGALTVNGNSYTINTSYYIIAAASKFVRPGSVRVSSNMISGVPNVAFKTPDNHIVSIYLNNTGDKKAFNIQYNGKTMQYVLNSGAVATFVWKQ